MRPLVTLLTDFGTADGYVAEMKGVILSAVPDATVVDVTHDVPPQDAEAGRLVVARYWRRFPRGTVHVAVVDPGVGSSRAALAVASDGWFLVGPDNGLLSPALLAAGVRVVSLPVPPNAAPTFHGRDVFAPAATMLLSGAPLDRRPGDHDRPLRQRDHESRRSRRRRGRRRRSDAGRAALLRGRRARRARGTHGLDRARRDRRARRQRGRTTRPDARHARRAQERALGTHR